MAGEWRDHEWGEIATLEYGKSLRDYRSESGRYRVYGTNGPIGWYEEPLCTHPGVIVGRKGAYRGIHYSPGPFFVIDTAFYLEPRQKLDLRWAYYCLLTYDINSMDSGSAIPSTSREAFYRLPVRVPPLKEQQAIACVLGSLDDKIELNRKMNQTLEAMARAIFKSWFVDFDPVRAKSAVRRAHPHWTDEQVSRAACPNLKPEIAALFPDAFEDSELGEIPKGWRVGTVADIAQINSWTLGRRDALDIIEYIEISEVMRGEIGTITYYNRGEEPSRARRRLRHGDTALSTVRPDRGAYFLALDPSESLVASTGFAVLTARDGNWAFLYIATTHPSFIQELGRLADGGAYPAIRPEVIGGRNIGASYNTALIDLFDSTVQPLFIRAEVNRDESRTLAGLRDALLPKLISGELRVADAERIAGRLSG